jgi:hypothetical protein
MRLLRRTPKKDTLKTHFEKTLVGLGLVTPTSAAPQLYNIWVLNHVAGLSPLTTGTALLMSTLWTAYGLIERRRALWLVNGAWVVLNAATLVGIVVSGGLG